jgi:glycosyltransferase involved in cell wall biosynthesis
VLSQLGFKNNSSLSIHWDVIEKTRHTVGKWSDYSKAIDFYMCKSAKEYLSLPRFSYDLVEIPVSLPDDEMLIDRLGIRDPRLISGIWQAILRESHARGELFTLQLHPERILMCQQGLSDILQQAGDMHPQTWVATLQEITEWWRERSQFSWQVTSLSEGTYKVVAHCSDRATLLFRNCRLDGPATSWTNGYQSVNARSFIVESPKRPVIGMALDSSQEAIDFLKSEGFWVEQSSKSDNYSIYLTGLADFRSADEKSLARSIEDSGAPLIRYWRWPEQMRSALSVTGDIDSITLGDFLRRVFEDTRVARNRTSTKVKRACIVRQTYYPWQKNVRRNSETLVTEGYHVDIICQRDKGQSKHDTINNVNVHRLPLRHHRESVFWYLFDYATFFLLSFLKLAQLSLKQRYDVVEVDTMPDFLVFIGVFPRLLGSKVIIYMYENTPQLFMSGFNVGPDHIGTRLLRLIEKASARFASHVIVSDGLPYKRVLEEHGIPSDKITVVMNVPDNSVFDSETPMPVRDESEFRLVSVSTLVKRYGVQTLIKAIPLIIKEVPRLVVDIIGDGEYRPELQKSARNLEVDMHVNFIGHVPHDTVPSYIARADICMAPIRDDVGVPNKLFEYFALGKPVIATAMPSLLETFDDRTILYFRPGDEKDLAAKFLELYYNPDKRASLGAFGKNAYHRYHWPIMIGVYLNVYRQLIT